MVDIYQNRSINTLNVYIINTLIKRQRFSEWLEINKQNKSKPKLLPYNILSLSNSLPM